jgi:hypothetical protein
MSADGKYLLQTEKVDGTTGVYASFSVQSLSNQAVIFRCYDRYRTTDLKAIEWAADSNDIVVNSADVGTITYQHKNGTWAISMGDVEQAIHPLPLQEELPLQNSELQYQIMMKAYDNGIYPCAMLHPLWKPLHNRKRV